MQLQIQSPHFVPNDALVNEVTTKLDRLEKMYDRIEKCTVMLKHEKNDEQKGYIVEVRLAVPKEDLFAKESTESYSRSLDNVIDDLKKQLIKHKEKLKGTDKTKEKISVEELSSE